MAAEASGDATDFFDEYWATPPGGWTFDQAKELELPFDDWELVDGVIVARGRAKLWHNEVRDEICDLVKEARVKPLRVLTECCVMLDEQNVRVPDIIVYDPTGLDFHETDCVPVGRVQLAVEVVSPGSRATDRIIKPAHYAAARVPFYWRVELERDDQLAVHEYWLNADTRSYIPAPSHPVHRRQLATDVPFPVKIDLAELLTF
jgi:Uma2 family endonuclease